MMKRKDWHKSITTEIVCEAVERGMTTLDNPGFCLVCGEPADSCEPDAEDYECEVCGKHAVCGAELVLMCMA